MMSTSDRAAQVEQLRAAERGVTRVYTDGSNPAPAPGCGWAWYVAPDRHGSGFAGERVGINAAEVGAILEAIRSADPSEDLLILSDSATAIMRITDPQPPGWHSPGGGRRTEGKALLFEVAGLVVEAIAHRPGRVELAHVRAHGRADTLTDVIGNAAADWLAVQAATSATPGTPPASWATLSTPPPPRQETGSRHSPMNPPLHLAVSDAQRRRLLGGR